MSPASEFLDLAKRLISEKLLRSEYNAARRAALMLAIQGRMEFGLDDFKWWEAHEWFYINDGWEVYYAAACKAKNLSACKAIEHRLRRQPFVWEGKRLFVGHRYVFRWQGELVTATRFDDTKGVIILCSYYTFEELKAKHEVKQLGKLGEGIANGEAVRFDPPPHRSVVKKVFRVTSAEMKAAEKARKAAAKKVKQELAEEERAEWNAPVVMEDCISF